MKKITKMLLFFVLCSAALFLISCGSNKDSTFSMGEQPAMGRYVEKISMYPIEENIQAVTSVKKSDGSLDLYIFLDQSPWYVMYNTKDAINYVQQEIPWYDELGEMEYGIISIAYDMKDNKYVLVSGGPENDNKVFKIGEDNKLVEIKMEWKESQSPAESLKLYFESMKVAQNGDLLLFQYWNGIMQYSPDGRLIAQYGGGNNNRFTVSGDNVFIIDEDSSQISVYDVNTHEQVRTVSYDNMTWEAALSGGSGGSLYLTDRSGVYRLADGGSLWEKIIDGELTSLSIPSLYFDGVIETAPGEFYILFADSESNNSIFKYEYDENISTLPGTELVVYTLKENNTLRQTAGELQRKNPDIRVNIMVGIDNESSVTKDDAVRALNTEIFAGKGPDLILLDGMDVESYVSKGILTDLAGVVKEVNESGEKLIDSVVNTYEEDSKIFAVPSKFTVPSMWIDEEYAGSVKDLKALADFAMDHNDLQVFHYSSYSDLMKIFSLSSGSSWFDKDGNLDEKSMAEFLTRIKEIYDSGKKYMKAGEERIERGNGSSTRAQAVVDSIGNSTDIFSWVFGRAYTYCANMISYNSANAPFLAVAERSGGVTVPLPGQAENVFIPVNIIGINAKTAKTDIAMEFVKLMLSSPVQNANTYDGFPVNIKSLEYGAKGRGNENISLAMSNDFDEGEMLWGRLPSEEELRKVMELCLSVKTPCVPDYTILEMIIDESKEYFDGGKTVEQTVSQIKERTRLYLSE